MKKSIPIVLLLLMFGFHSRAQEPIPYELYFSFTDTEGNSYNISDYLNAGKPLFLFEFSNAPSSYAAYEALNLEELYNTYGQGGTNEIEVLFLASYGFETEADLSNLDYSATLGEGYENVSFTENNPIPVGLIAQNPNTMYYDSSATVYGLCPDWVYFTSIGPEPEDYMSALYNNCCGGGTLPYDPGLADYTSFSIPDCNPQELNFHIVNFSPLQMDSTTFGISINNSPVEEILYTDTIGGCKSVEYDYSNQNIQVGDIVSAYIINENQQTNNDTILFQIEPVDTVRGQIRVDIINPASEDAYGFAASIPPLYAEAKITSNWWNQFYFNYQSGCQVLQYYYSEEILGDDEAFMISSINDDDSVEDTLVYITGSFDHENSYRRNLFIEAPVPYYSFGYIFENVENDVFYNPAYPPIQGMKISAGTHTTFSEEDGYYKLSGFNLPLIPENDQEVWPLMTAGTTNFINYNAMRSLGFSFDNPVFKIETTFQNGSPVSCENENFKQSIHIFNEGNTTASGKVLFTHDPELSVDYCIPPPISVSANELTFEYSNLDQSGKDDFQIFYENIGSELIGQFLSSTIETTVLDNGTQVFDESVQYHDSIFCQSSPNNIFGYPLGLGPGGLIPASTQALSFRIQFQNNSPDTVHNIFVSHIVPDELNWGSIQLGNCSLNVQVAMDSVDREMTFLMKNVNLPSSSENLDGSKGYIWYSADLNDLNIGDQILNSATIWLDNYFQQTNTSVHTISNLVSVDEIPFQKIKCYPNPVKNFVYFDLENRINLKTVVFYDASGKQVKQIQISTQRVGVDLSSFAAGSYSILFLDENQTPQLQSTVIKVN